MQINALLILCAVAPVMSMLRGTGDQSLTSNMQPEVVRKLLNNVQLKWIHTRAMVLSNATSDSDGFSEMEKSCVKVSSSIVAGSEGDKDRVNEYMKDVCNANSVHNDRDLCSSFAAGVEAVMTDDSEYNRDELKMSQFCRKLWDKAVTSAAQAEAKERAEKAEEERREREEAEKKAAAEREEAEKKAAEEAAKEKAAAEQAMQDAAKVKAYEAEANKTSASQQANATDTSVQTALSNSTVAQPSSSIEQTNSSTALTAEVSTANATLATNAKPADASQTTEKNANATSVTDAQTTENKTNSVSVAQAGDKNATVTTDK